MVQDFKHGLLEPKILCVQKESQNHKLVLEHQENLISKLSSKKHIFVEIEKSGFHHEAILVQVLNGLSITLGKLRKYYDFFYDDEG